MVGTIELTTLSTVEEWLNPIFLVDTIELHISHILDTIADPVAICPSLE